MWALIKLKFMAYKWAILLSAALVVLIGTNIWSFSQGKKVEKASWLLSQAEAVNQRELERQQLEAMGRQVVKKLQDQERKANDYYRKWRAEIGKVTSGGICLSPGAVGVWDAGLYGEGDLPATAPGTAEAASATDTAVLTNATDNFRQYAECRRQLNALIDWHER